MGVEEQRIKIITTVVLNDAPTSNGTVLGDQEVTVVKQGKHLDQPLSPNSSPSSNSNFCYLFTYSGKMDVLRLVCSDGSVLGITELQPPGTKHSIN